MFQSDFLAVAEQFQEFAGAVAAGNNEDLVDAGIDKGLDRIINHRPVVHRQQMLVGDFSQGKQAGPKSPRENNAFHNPPADGYFNSRLRNFCAKGLNEMLNRGVFTSDERECRPVVDVAGKSGSAEPRVEASPRTGGNW